MKISGHIVLFSVIAVVGALIVYNQRQKSIIAKASVLPDDFIFKPCSGTALPPNWPGIKYYKKDGKFFYFNQALVGSVPDIKEISLSEYSGVYEDSLKPCPQIG